jgi:hypothetical protein
MGRAHLIPTNKREAKEGATTLAFLIETLNLLPSRVDFDVTGYDLWVQSLYGQILTALTLTVF